MNSKVQRIDRDVTDRSLSYPKATRFTASLVPLMALNTFVVLPGESVNAADAYIANIQDTVTSNSGNQPFRA